MPRSVCHYIIWIFHAVYHSFRHVLIAWRGQISVSVVSTCIIHLSPPSLKQTVENLTGLGEGLLNSVEPKSTLLTNDERAV